MLTAKEIHNCSAWENHWIIFPEHLTWPAHFAAHGYRTALIGKMHFGGRDQMNGFQHRPYGDLRHGLGHQPEPLELFPGYAAAQSAGITEIPESLLSDVVITKETLAHMLEQQDTDPDVPWFVCASYTRPHSPFTAPGRYLRYYRDNVPPLNLPPNCGDLLEPYARGLYDRPGEGNDMTAEQNQRGREAYYSCVDFVDDCIGELLAGLDKANLLENTIVIYTSDHGEMAGQHGLWGKGVYCQPAVGVPFLISGPGIRSGHHQLKCPISLMDLFPTTCALAGLPIPDGLDGVDFSCLLADPQNERTLEPRAFAPSAYLRYGVRVKHKGLGKGYVLDDQPCRAMRMIRQRDWKYVEIEKGQPLLFDMVNDPGENTNLAGQPEHVERCRKMREQLFRGFSWQEVHKRLESDRQRLPQFLSGLKPSTPNQYMLKDGRVFDAEKELYDARWLYIPPEATGGIIPQQFG